MLGDQWVPFPMDPSCSPRSKQAEGWGFTAAHFGLAQETGLGLIPASVPSEFTFLGKHLLQEPPCYLASGTSPPQCL